MKDFKDRVVVITGAGSGIGRATAHAFSELGAWVHVVDVAPSRAEAVAAELRLMGRQAWSHVVDVRDADALATLAQTIYTQHDRVDVLINNAGVGHGGFVQELSLEDWKWVLDTNLWGVIHGIHAFVPRLIDQGTPCHIVNTASIAGLVGIPSMAPYCASKFAIVGLSESLGAELAPHGISVTAVCPGIINTDIIAGAKFGDSVENSRGRVVDYYRKHGISADRVASDIVKAVRRERPVQLTIGSAYPVLWLKRLSPRLFRGAASLAARTLLRGDSR